MLFSRTKERGQSMIWSRPQVRIPPFSISSPNVHPRRANLLAATSLARRGARLVIWSINRTGVEQVAKDLNVTHPGKVIPQVVDVMDRSIVKSAPIEARKHFGSIHGIANSAGTGGYQLGMQPVWETAAEEFDVIVRLNIGALSTS
ncbi:hypothetical protein BJX96DRAFT_144981 [Aspergillus floccosus]